MNEIEKSELSQPTYQQQADDQQREVDEDEHRLPVLHTRHEGHAASSEHGSGVELETEVKRRFAKLSIVSYSQALRLKFPWEITQPNLNLGTFYDTELNSEGEGPSRGLLRDYESSDGPSFQALV